MRKGLSVRQLLLTGFRLWPERARQLEILVDWQPRDRRTLLTCFSRHIYDSFFFFFLLKTQLELWNMQTNGEFTHAVDIYIYIYISNPWPLYKLWRFCNHVPNCCLIENQTSCLQIEISLSACCGNQYIDFSLSFLFFFFVFKFVLRLLNSCLVSFFLLRAGEYHACF